MIDLSISRRVALVAAFIFLTGGHITSAAEPTVQQLLDQVGIKPQGDLRGQMDTVGFVVNAAQMESVLVQVKELAAPREKALVEQYGWDEQTAFSAGICPHDDYAYAGRLYQLLLPRVRARRVILFGVFHKARYFNCRDQLVFEAFQSWRGPFGPVPVSDLREEILKRLPAQDFVVSNDMQTVEHSLEALVPFLQTYNREVEIVPILVPYMNWEKLDSLAGDLAAALTAILKEKGWKLGQDVALLCSSDAVHYGDSGWGGSNYAPFGADINGYKQAVERDESLLRSYLCGSLGREKLKGFMDQCVNPDDVKQYRITWCGRFSIPLGLNVAARVAQGLQGRSLEGYCLDYGTSVSEATLDYSALSPLGVTAPNNLHHWVGYAAVGYR
jgi:MEMO1 family protein